MLFCIESLASYVYVRFLAYALACLWTSFQSMIVHYTRLI